MAPPRKCACETTRKNRTTSGSVMNGNFSSNGGGLQSKLVGGGDRNQVLLNGVLDEFRTVMHVDFPHEVVFVHIHCFDAQVEMNCNLLYRQSLSKQLEHLTLPGAQAIVAGLRSASVLDVTGDDLSQNVRTQIAVTLVHYFDRMHQLRSGRVLHDVPRSSGFETTGYQLLFIMHREDQNLYRFIRLAYAPGGFEAVQVGHLDIHEHNVRMQQTSLFNGLTSVTRFAHHLDGLLGSENRPDAFAIERVIVTEEYSDLACHRRGP